uniref:Uncharacterized protein n=1 Tax=Meloidogyne enterolobii TaxID=390850 RepID=A0A6V7U0N9_MELEN|nr:unnamed protein product [Meloidogyne enterolobii]
MIFWRREQRMAIVDENLTKIFEEIGVQTEEEQIIKEEKKLFENNFTQTEEKKMINSENQTDGKLEKDSANQTDEKLLKDSANQTDKISLQDSAFQTEEEVSKIFKQNCVNSIAQTLATTILNKEEGIQTLPVLPPKIQSISSQTEELKQIPVFVHFIESAVQTDFMLPSPVVSRKDSFEANTLNNSTCKTNATPPRNSSFSSTNEVLELNVTQLPFNDIFSTPASSDDKQQQKLCSLNTLHKKLKEKCQDVDRLEQQNSFLNKIIADQQMAIEQMKKCLLEEMEENGKIIMEVEVIMLKVVLNQRKYTISYCTHNNPDMSEPIYISTKKNYLEFLSLESYK